MNHIFASSVVPKITRNLREFVRKRGGFSRLWVVGEEIKVPLKHRYLPINSLGSDRLVNAYGALKIYGPPLLLLDYGTALTCDYLSEKGVFLGGLIIPGPEISLEALCERAALLPRIGFPKGGTAGGTRSSLMGRDTQAGMEAGILQGYGAMTDGLVLRFRKHYGRKFRVVATGGLAQTLAPYTSLVDTFDPLLTLKSLAELYKGRINLAS